jgi:hypothetical protein
MKNIFFFKYKINGYELEFDDVFDINTENQLVNLIEQNNITKLVLSGKILKPLDNLPNGLIELLIYPDFTYSLNDLPNSITHIYLVNYSNTLNCLCGSVRVINLGNKFNNPINNLPSRLEEIVLGDLFNQPIGMLPENLNILKLGKRFNQPVYRLPCGLEELYFNNSFSNQICELPNGLKKITLGTCFTKPICLPKSLEKIKLSSRYKYVNLLQKIIGWYVIKELY